MKPVLGTELCSTGLDLEYGICIICWKIGIGQMSAFDLLFSVRTKHLDYYQCNETSVTADSSSATKARNLHCSRLAVVSIFTDAEN